jgi:hypothetical protein
MLNLAMITRERHPAEPWRSFFAEVDSLLSAKIHLHCCGGFVAAQCYGVARTTNDVDFLGVVPFPSGVLTELAGKGSALHRRHGIYVEFVAVGTPLEDYQERLIPMFPGVWTHLRLYALEAHDLALSKLERNSDKDRDDIKHLASAGHIKPEILKERYYRELRPNLTAHEERHDLTLQLWLESYW